MILAVTSVPYDDQAPFENDPNGSFVHAQMSSPVVVGSLRPLRFARAVVGSTPMEWPTQQVREVADGVVAVLQGEGESGVANAGFVYHPGDRDALVVDTMMFPEMAAGLVAQLDARGLR